MQFNTQYLTETPRPAASVVVLRDHPTHGLEVFLLQRHSNSHVLGGAYVFPGGKLDPEDSTLPSHHHPAHSEQQLHARLTEADTPTPLAKGLFIAAIRETLEETGIFFAQGTTLEHSQHAWQQLQQGLAFHTLLAHTGAVLQTELLTPWSRWITPHTPHISNKRFDTRFFVARMPAEQMAQHDNHEATASAWLTPRQALHAYWARDIELAPPQIMSLVHLARHNHVQSVIDEAQRQPVPLVFPETFESPEGRAICYPGDPAHSQRARALPGPTRLVYRHQRFEPLEGFEALFT